MSVTEVPVPSEDDNSKHGNEADKIGSQRRCWYLLHVYWLIEFLVVQNFFYIIVSVLEAKTSG